MSLVDQIYSVMTLHYKDRPEIINEVNQMRTGDINKGPSVGSYHIHLKSLLEQGLIEYRIKELNPEERPLRPQRKVWQYRLTHSGYSKREKAISNPAHVPQLTFLSYAQLSH